VLKRSSGRLEIRCQRSRLKALRGMVVSETKRIHQLPPGSAERLALLAKRAAVRAEITRLKTGSLSWRLTRSGKIFARGSARVRDGNATIRLPDTDDLPPGSYRLQIGGQKKTTAVVIG
jgi:hypothetical protein